MVNLQIKNRHRYYWFSLLCCEFDWHRLKVL